MTIAAIREQLHRQLDTLPDELLIEIADFAAFVLVRRKGATSYTDWSEAEWRKFALGQFLRESDDAEYTLAAAERVLKSSAQASSLR